MFDLSWVGLNMGLFEFDFAENVKRRFWVESGVKAETGVQGLHGLFFAGGSFDFVIMPEGFIEFVFFTG